MKDVEARRLKEDLASTRAELAAYKSMFDSAVKGDLVCYGLPDGPIFQIVAVRKGDEGWRAE